ncbi:MAG: TPM domain-containing protein [Chitinophagales bacterium]
MASHKLFSAEQGAALVQEITRAELQTSGEIRVHTEPHCNATEPMLRALEVFHKLGMNNTVRKNGVLIYIAYNDKKFAIIGDEGINAVVPANFWDGTRQVMQGHFQKHEFFEGVAFAIRETGELLKQYFPLGADDKNELPNEISEGE